MLQPDLRTIDISYGRSLKSRMPADVNPGVARKTRSPRPMEGLEGTVGKLFAG